MSLVINSEKELVAVATKLAPHLQQSDVITLVGDLGVGKTVFSRALVRALIGDDTLDVSSPTFNLLHSYDLPSGYSFAHYDLYRLEHPDEIYDLGIEDTLRDSIVCIEWPQIIMDMLPSDRLEIEIAYGSNESERIVHMKGNKRLVDCCR